MPNCKHPSVTIQVEYAKTAGFTSMRDIDPPVTHVVLETYGPLRYVGYWSRAHIHVRCLECGHTAEFTSADWRAFPKWLTRHWLTLIQTSRIAAEVNDRYGMFQEAPCHPS